MKTNEPDGSTPPQLAHFERYNELQQAVYHLLPLDFLFDIYAPVDNKLSAGYFRDLILKSLREFHCHMQAKTQAEVTELGFTYLRCITFLADHANLLCKSLTKAQAMERGELAEAIVDDLLDLIIGVHQYWGDCHADQIKVPDVLFERNEEKILQEQYEQVKKMLKMRHIDSELADILLPPLYEITYDFYNAKTLTWQRLRYSKLFMSKLLALQKKGKITTELLLTKLMELNYNHAAVTGLYIKMIRKQMTGCSSIIERMQFLREERINTRGWHLPEHKGLHPAEACTKDIVMPSLDDLLSIQEMQYESQRKLAVVLPTKKKETMVIAWMIKIWKEIMLLPSVSYSEAVDAFFATHGFDVGAERVKNALSEMVTKDDHDKVSDEVAEAQRMVDIEWKRNKEKKDKNT